MVRDNFASDDYFTEKLLEEGDYLAGKRPIIEQEINTLGAQASGLCSAIVRTQLFCASLSYSRGDAIEDVREWVLSAFDDLKHLNELCEILPNRMRGESSYLTALYFLTYTILYAPERAQKDQVIFNFDFQNLSDPLLLAMRSHIMGEPIDQISDVADLKYPDDFADLWRAVIQPGQSAIPPLVRYLETWYQRNSKDPGKRGATGVGSHQKMIRYRGYWCWEAAAVVVMMGIDDTSFRDHEHYPKDLVDWAWAQKSLGRRLRK